MILSGFLLLLFVSLATTAPAAQSDGDISITSSSTSSSISTTRKRHDNAFTDADWVVNANHLSLGFNPIRGNPVCFTGNCRMDGFGSEVFKFNYTKTPTGSCTTKLIPQHVTLICDRWDDVQAKTEEISSYDELSESYSKGSSNSAGIGIGSISFQYGESEQTTKMLTDIYIYNYSLFYTHVTTSYLRLSSIIPLLELSDVFRDTIEKMPPPSDESSTEKYVREKILDVFGYTIMSEITLGGVAQQLTTIEREEKEKIRQDGLETTKEVGFSFIVSFGKKETESRNNTSHTKFMKHVKNTQASTVGGEPFTLLEEQDKTSENSGDTLPSRLTRWMASVPSNPVVIKFKLESLVSLLTKERFPNSSSNIEAKAQAIEKVINRLTNSTKARCFKDCTGPLNGRCVPDSSSSNAKNKFNFGRCECSPNFSGPDCSQPAPMATAPTTPTRTSLQSG